MKNAKKAVIWLLILIFSFSGLSNVTVDAAYNVTFPINSKAVYMVNTDTKAVIYEKNSKEKIYPASLTKIMTAIVAIEHVKDLEGTIVTAPPYIYDEFVNLNASNADINRGEQVRMIDLLYALILQSACEVGSIIADYVGDGSIPDFVDMMNAKAKEIGALDTNFTNSHGLFNKDQLTTAYDMYLIAQYAMNIPIFEKICTTTSYLMPATNNHSKPRYVTHTNNMLSKFRGGSKYYYPDMKGVKTGTLDQVGKNLISTASRDGYNYMLVTLSAPAVDENGKAYPKTINKSYDDAKQLYNWAFTNFKQQKVLKQNEVITEIPVKLATQQDYITLVAKEDVLTLLPTDVDISAIQKSQTVPKQVNAPIKKGDVLGKLELKLSNEVIATIDLVALEDVSRNTPMYILDLTGKFLSKPLVIVLLVILIILFLLFFVLSLRYKKLQKRRAMRARKRNSMKY